MAANLLGTTPQSVAYGRQLYRLYDNSPVANVRGDTAEKTTDTLGGTTPALKGAIHPGGPLVVVPRER